MDVAALYTKYADWVYRKCLKYTNSPQDAEDLVHEIFLEIHKSPAGFKGESSEFTWLYRVTVNHGCSYLRKRYRQRERLEAMDEEPMDSHGDHAVEVTHAVDLQKIFSSIDSKTQQILFLLAVEGLTQEEVATITGISRRALNKRLAKQHASLGTYFEGRVACLIILWVVLVSIRQDSCWIN